MHLARVVESAAKLACLGAAIAIATSLFAAWYAFELVSHFRAQYLVIAVVATAITAWRRAWWWAALGLACVVATAPGVVAWYIPPTAGVPGGPRDLRLMHANVNSTNTRYDALIDLVHEERPDILVIQEASGAWVRRLAALAGVLPYRKVTARLGGRGIAALSAMPLEEASVAFLGRHPAHFIFPSVVFKVVVNGTPITIVTSHPASPLIPRWFHSRNAQLAGLHGFLQEVKGPRIIVGDLNTTPWSPYYASLVQKSGLVDARRGFGLLPTWPTPLAVGALGIPIDHCLVSPDLTVVNIRTGRSIHSDHLPLIADLKMGGLEGPPKPPSARRAPGNPGRSSSSVGDWVL